MTLPPSPNEQPGQQPSAGADARINGKNSVPVRFQVQTQKSWVTYALVGVCIFFYILQVASRYILGVDLPAEFGAKVNEAILQGQVWRLITPMFLHGPVLHIGFNMYALYIIGRSLELFYGNVRFLLLALISGFSGAVFSFLFNQAPSYGASTAIFGLVAAEAVFIIMNRRIFPDPRSRLVNIAVIVVVNLMIGLSPGIDNWGHLGGLVGGAIFAYECGPVYKLTGLFPDLTIRDTRPDRRILLASIGVPLGFSLLVGLRFFLR